MKATHEGQFWACRAGKTIEGAERAAADWWRQAGRDRRRIIPQRSAEIRGGQWWCLVWVGMGWIRERRHYTRAPRPRGVPANSRKETEHDPR